jgi:hypothetical protein
MTEYRVLRQAIFDGSVVREDAEQLCAEVVASGGFALCDGESVIANWPVVEGGKVEACGRVVVGEGKSC